MRPLKLLAALFLCSLSAIIFTAAVGPSTPATAQQATGSLVVLKDCLIVGPDGKVQVPPPPEGPFQLELSKGTSTPQSYTPEAIIASFSILCGQTRTFTGLEPGTYNVFEEDSPGDFGQIANFCVNVPVAAGQTSECLLTNEKFTNLKGAIVVHKDCLDFNPATQTFGDAQGQGNFGVELLKGTSPLPAQRPPGPTPRGTFTLEDEIADFQLVCGDFRTFSGLAPGLYSAFETSGGGGLPGQFREFANDCINVLVQAQGTAECRITNEKLSTGTPAPTPTTTPAVITPPATGDGGIR